MARVSADGPGTYSSSDNRSDKSLNKQIKKEAATGCRAPGSPVAASFVKQFFGSDRYLTRMSVTAVVGSETKPRPQKVADEVFGQYECHARGCRAYSTQPSGMRIPLVDFEPDQMNERGCSILE